METGQYPSRLKEHIAKGMLDMTYPFAYVSEIRESSPSCNQAAWHPGRLWSLWDIMKSFRAAEFMKLGQIAGITWAVSRLDRLNSEATGREEQVIISFEQSLASLEGDFIDLELTTSLTTLRKMQRAIKEVTQSHSAKLNILISLQEELHGRLIDEMEGKLFLTLNIKEAEWYKNPRKGWEEIIVRFPNSEGDIEEAYKCFALARYAAAVFHSLQVVEAGLLKFGELIGVTDPLPGWTATTGRLKKILDTKYPDRTPFEQANSAFLEQMYAAIHALQLAWRNKVSHVAGKLFVMTSDFHPEVAEVILVTSRALMRRLATEAPWPNAS
jgi:hypothetical protein